MLRYLLRDTTRVENRIGYPRPNLMLDCSLKWDRLRHLGSLNATGRGVGLGFIRAGDHMWALGRGLVYIVGPSEIYNLRIRV
jgi:hypothetical protein